MPWQYFLPIHGSKKNLFVKKKLTSFSFAKLTRQSLCEEATKQEYSTKEHSNVVMQSMVNVAFYMSQDF